MPRGTHGIPAEQISRNQRERMIAATAQETYENGYVGTTVRSIVGRAGVSSATFYREFENLDACVIATFWELHDRLMSEIGEVCVAPETDVPKARLALRRSLQLFATDPAAARLLTVEILAVGTAGAQAQHEGIARTARQLGIEGKAGWGLVALVSSLVAERVIAREAERIPELEPELGEVVEAYRAAP